MRARRLNLVLRNRSFIINALRGAWVLLVLWFELGVFRWSLRGCTWPDGVWKQANKSTKEGGGTTTTALVAPAHLLVIADTQVLDSRSLPTVIPLFRRLVRFIVHSNLRKSWAAAVSRLDPHGVLFLGDMINGGRYARDDEEYESMVHKFRHIFALPPNIPAYYAVGNHDVGLGRSILFSQRSRARFQRFFNVSQPNRIVTFGNHSLVLVDAPGLVEEDYRRVNEGKIYPLRSTSRSGKKQGGKAKRVWTPSRGGSMEFIKEVAKDRQTQTNPLPLVLFSHIPFARAERWDCGPLREGKGLALHIQKGAGPGYQNLLGKATSTWTLETLEPIAVFTADDHDYCEITHTYLGSPRRANGTTVQQLSSEEKKGEEEEGVNPPLWDTKTAKETTVKTFSTGAGVRRPGLQLLSFWNRVDPLDESVTPDVELVNHSISPNPHASLPTFMDRPCLLPDQTDIYTHGYLPFILLSLALLIWLNLKAPPRSKLSLTAANTHNKSLSSFDARYLEKASVGGGSYDDDDDREGTPHTSAMNRATSLAQHTSILHPTASGLRTPVMQGSSPFASPPLSPVLLPPDMDRDGDGDNGNGKGSDDDDGKDGDGDTPIARRVNVDEEKGLRTGSPRFRSTPRTPTSYSFPNNPTPGASGKWEAGTWRRGGGGSSARTLFGNTSGNGLGLGIRGGEREKEKAEEVGWRRVHGSALGGWAGMGMWRRGVGWWARVVHGALLGRPLSSVNSAGTSFWRRCAWDGMCVALPGWVCFGVVSWWYLW